MKENNQTLNTSTLSVNNRDENINVVVRIRGKKTEENGSCTLLNILDNKSIQVDNKTYYYDYVANMNSTQEEMFQHCAKRICDNSLKGYNGTIFAYGQTGSGKTFTLLGPNITKYSDNNRINNNFSLDNTNIEMNDLSQDNDILSISGNNSAYHINRKSEAGNQNLYYYDINDQGIGLLPRIIYYLFNNSQKTENVDFKFKISYLEIYQEYISDLLNPDNSKFIQLRDLGSSIILDGLRKLIITSPEEALRFIIQGNRLRHTASTLMNNESSRSHAVISIYIEKTISQKINNTNNRAKIQKSVFHIIDLAGSERQNKTGVIGERIREAGAINKSLLNLSIVIRDIINNKKQIPYRDSKLTHLLRDSLGGNAKTSIIAAVSPFDSNINETKSTLNFAQNAKKVKNHAIVNEEISKNEKVKILKEYNSVLEENLRLKEELARYQHDNNSLESRLIDVEVIDKGIDDFVREMNNLQEQNAKLRDKIEKNELELKIRDKKIESLKEQINNYIQNIRNLIKEKNEYIGKNVILNGQLKEEENEKMKLEKHYKDQILIMEQNNKNTELIINNKNIIIDDFTKAYIEEMKRRKEAEMRRREMQEREKKRREEFEARAKAEMIQIENKKKEEKKKKEQEERAKFESQIANTTFEEFIQISLEKGESEILYLDLDSFSKVKMAVLITDEEEKMNFVLSGPNARGRTSVIYKVDNKNYLFYEYESLRKGEYTVEITNRGSKENELIFLVNEHVDKKKDLINTEKIDKISMLLNNIDNNVNQLRNKKKIEIRQINSHNEKVDKNNRNIVIYSIIEIFTMIIVFIAQSYYISSIVTKL